MSDANAPTIFDELIAELNDTTEKSNKAIEKIAHLEREVEDLYTKYNELLEDFTRHERGVKKLNPSSPLTRLFQP